MTEEKKLDTKLNLLLSANESLVRGIQMTQSGSLYLLLYLFEYIFTCFIPCIFGAGISIVKCIVNKKEADQQTIRWKEKVISRVERFVVRKFRKHEINLPSFERDMVAMKLGLDF